MTRWVWFDERGRVRAVGPVHRHAPAAGDEPHDLVAGDGGAAAGQAHHHVVEALDVDADGPGPQGPRRVRRPGGGDGQLLLAAPQLPLDPLGDRPGRHVALADRGVERLEVVVVQRGRDLAQRRGLGQLLDRQPLLVERLGQVVAAGVDRVDAPLPGEPLADLAARPRRVDELQPVEARPRPLDLAGEHLDGVPRAQHRVEGRQAAVQAGADAAMADLGVDRVREVDRRRPGRERHHLALRGEDEDLVLLEVDLQGLHELGRVVGVLLPVDHPLQPGQVLGR